MPGQFLSLLLDEDGCSLARHCRGGPGILHRHHGVPHLRGLELRLRWHGFSSDPPSSTSGRHACRPQRWTTSVSRLRIHADRCGGGWLCAFILAVSRRPRPPGAVLHSAARLVSTTSGRATGVPVKRPCRRLTAPARLPSASDPRRRRDTWRCCSPQRPAPCGRTL